MEVFGNIDIIENIVKYLSIEEDEENCKTLLNLACLNKKTFGVFQSHSKLRKLIRFCSIVCSGQDFLDAAIKIESADSVKFI